jgi:hypothetical protein
MQQERAMKYNQVSYKQSHNSENRNEDVDESLAWHANDPGRGGCRGLEYDFWRHSDGTMGRSREYFTVSHLSNAKSAPPLANYLESLLSWNKKFENHDVIFVTLDIKSSGGARDPFPEEIDNYLTQWFERGLIFRPADLSPRSDDFVAYVKVNGWPAVTDMRNKFLFCLSGNKEWKSYYAAKDPRSRLCFSDIDFDDGKSVTVPLSGQRVIYSSNLHSSKFERWKASIAALRSANLMARGYVLNSEAIWNKARQAKLNIFSTDKITGHAWAHVGDAPFVGL